MNPTTDPESLLYLPMREAIRLAADGMKGGSGGPFGCVVVKGGVIVGRGWNQVTSTNDPTAHAEIVAIRDACRHLGKWSLPDCALFASCEPCPMCLAAIYWARLPVFYYGCTRQDAAAIGFDDDFIYRQVALPVAEREALQAVPLLRDEALLVFADWSSKPDRIPY